MKTLLAFCCLTSTLCHLPATATAALQRQLPFAVSHETHHVSSFDPLEDLRKALDVMQSDNFQLWVGTWPTAIDWTAAVIDTYLVSALTSLSKALDGSSGDDFEENKQVENELNQYFAHNTAYYFGENAFSIRNQAFDDMLWVNLGWLESIKFIRTHSQRHYRPVDTTQTQPWHGSQFIAAFAHRARVFYDITTRGWDTHLCGGGMVWNPALGPYKNAITNQLYISASVGMYLYFPGDDNTSPFSHPSTAATAGSDDPSLPPAEPHDPAYLHAAIAGYDWLARIGMTNAQGLYVDGFHISNWRTNGTTCDQRNEMVYTYNQGVILSGLRGLWESTGNTTYLHDGHELVRNVMRATGWTVPSTSSSSTTEPLNDQWAGLGRAGILEDHCDSSGRCDQNAQTFKGIYFHHLTLFCEALPLEPLVPGKTWIADDTLAHLHRQSCKDYAIWVAHNARAALETRDSRGRFGMWWLPHDDVEKVSLPEGAVDYRNNASELFGERWRFGEKMKWEDAIRVLALPNGSKQEEEGEEESRSFTTQDLNDRGRGRTVETQGGGVAVLRATWELLNMS